MRVVQNSVIELEVENYSSYPALVEFVKNKTRTRGKDITPQLREVYIWGTKEVGVRLYEKLQNFGVKVLGVFDSNKSTWGNDWGSFKIGPPMPVDKPVILAAYEMQKLKASAEAQLPENEYISAWDVLLSLWNVEDQSWNGLQHPDDLSLEILERHRLIAERTETQAEYWKQVAARYFIGIESVSNSPTHKRDEEYFPPEVIKCHGSSAFLDIGAFDGDTLKRFFSLEVSLPDTRIAVAVEPSKRNLSGLLGTIGDLNMNALALNAAVGASHGIVRFEESLAGAASSLAKNSEGEFVAMVTIDSLSDYMTFTHVKMDIEGHERFALAGAEKAIAAGSAAWSVCSYHLADDFFEIPKYFDESYKMYCTSHAPRPWDTTFHFVK